MGIGRRIPRSAALALLVLPLMGMTMGPATTSSELLPNGTFEGGGSGSLSGWTQVSSSLSLASDGVGGGFAGKASFTGAASFGIKSSPLPVSKSTAAGTVYTGNGQVRSDTPGKKACLRLFEVSPTGTTVAFKETCLTTQSGWQAFPSVSYTAQGNGDSIAFRVLQSSGVAGNSFELDNLSLVSDASQAAPAAPTALQASAVSSSEIDLSWTASTSSGVTGYQVNRDGASVATIPAPAGTSVSYQDTGLAAASSHSYTVQALAGSLASGPSNQASATTFAVGPAAPTNLSVTNVTSSEVDLAWTASTGPNVVSYQVNRDGAPLATFADPGTSTITYQDTSVSSSTSYSYTVQAIDSAQTPSALSNSVSATTPSAGGGGDVTIGAVGDMACDPSDTSWNGGNGVTAACGEKRASDAMLADSSLQFILGLGDYQYDCDDLNDFAASYTPTWGRLNNLLRPVAGNHEYKTGTDAYGAQCPAGNATAQNYFTYFGAAAHPETAGHFSFNVGSWHIIALNANCGNSGSGGCGASSPQTQWLQSDLNSTTQPCILAYWHQPYFTGTPAGKQTAYQYWWQDLYAAHADLVLNGHIHNYFRFNQLNPSGSPDPNGIREVIVGTGGEDLGGGTTTANPPPAVFIKGHFGYLRLTLHADSYDASFIDSTGATMDSFSGTCH